MAETNSSDDPLYSHYTLKHRLTAWASIHLFDGISYTVRHGLLKGLKRKGGLGWVPEAFAGSLDSPELRFWREIDLRGQTVYDVGAFQGLLTLWFAKQAKRVVCFEPNTHNHKRLSENLALNSFRNVTVRKVGIGSVSEIRSMVGNPLMPGFSRVEMGTANGSLVTEAISISTVDEEISQHQLPAPDFIKIDIEGWEIEALRGARRTLESARPALFLEMHGKTMREKQQKVLEIVEFLDDVGYRHIRHIETGTNTGPQNASIAAQGHLYCRP